MSTQSLLDYCIAEIEKINVGNTFLVRDLFKGYEWSNFPIAIRITLGTLFLNYANNSTIIRPLGKSAQGQQKYEKL